MPKYFVTFEIERGDIQQALLFAHSAVDKHAEGNPEGVIKITVEGEG